MRKDLISSVWAIVLFTVAFGLAYPLLTTGVAQLAFPGKADGSRIERDGKVVGSRLIAQDFKGNPRYFQPRPSRTGYAGDASSFANLGPNQKQLAKLVRERIAQYRKLEGAVADIPVDAVTDSASGVDPHISQANARIQANRVARVRSAPLERVNELIDANTAGRFLGLLGEPGVNVLELNLALDKEFPQS